MQIGGRLRQRAGTGRGWAAARPHPAFSGWSVLGVASAALFCSQIAQSPGIAVFVDPMRAELGWSRSVISTAYTVATIVSAGVVLLAGRVIDRHGHRRVMLWTTILFALSLAAMGAVAKVVTLLLALLVMRISGGSVLSLAARTLVSTWFARRRGRAIGLLNLGKMLGVAVIPPGMALLVGGIGWRGAWYVAAILSVAMLGPAVVRWVWGRPEQIGQYPDGEAPERIDGKVVDIDAGSWTLAQARRTRAFWLLIAATAIPAFVTNGLSFSQISIFTDQGLSPALAATTFTIESIVALPVSLLAGWVADRYGSRYVLAVGNGALVLALICLIFTETVALAVVFAMLRAITSGTWVLGSEVTWPAYYGGRYLASIAGVSYAFAFFAAATGPLPFSLAYDLTGSYHPAIWGLIALPALTTVAALAALPPARKIVTNVD